MNNKASMGTIAIPLISSFLLMGAASSVIFDNSDALVGDAEQTLNGVLDEITTYLKIDDVIGKYYNTNGIRRIEKIVILVKQFIESTVNISDVTIKIRNSNDVMLLKYSGCAMESDSSAVFEHQVWETTNNTFSLIVVHDKDRSLLDYNIMNEDTAFIAIRLLDRFTMADDESIIVSIIPSTGITRSVVLETPSFHISNIISFGEI